MISRIAILGTGLLGTSVGLALRPDRFELSILGANLPRQVQPGDQPAITLDQVVGEIPG